jgi:Lon-like ATP-dependent protease
MEIIAIAGYITDEKVHIARDYLEKNTRQACGIKPQQVSWTLLSYNLPFIQYYVHENKLLSIEHLFLKQHWNFHK